jgi:hypothetical protein
MVFRRWVERTRPMVEHDVSLSLTRLVSADVWAPVGPTSGRSFGVMVRSLSPISAGLEALHQPWLASAIMAERAAKRHANGAVLAEIGADQPTGVDLGFVSGLTRPTDGERDALRREVRDRLGIGQDQPVLLMSCAHLDRPGLGPMLDALGRFRDDGPLLLVVGRRGWSISQAAAAHGCSGQVRHLGATGRMDAALSACDAAVAPFRAAGNGTTGRFIADAVLMGVPVLADPLAPGARLLRERPDAGEIVHGDWLGAIRRVVEQRPTPSDDVSMERFVERLVEVLERACR